MNKHYAHLTAALVGTLAAAGGTLAVSPAQASTAATSTVSATASDNMPASGQTFRLSGNVRSSGQGTPATIRVKTLRNGAWVRLTGATMHTDSSGHYSIRVILDAKGKRQLRVVANPDSSSIRNSRRTLAISVGMPGNETCD
ncbi:MAG: hypothetical protein QM747_07390 [Nocardioides sp.]